MGLQQKYSPPAHRNTAIASHRNFEYKSDLLKIPGFATSFIQHYISAEADIFSAVLYYRVLKHVMLEAHDPLCLEPAIKSPVSNSTFFFILLILISLE